MGAVVCAMRRLLFIKRWTELKRSKINKANALIAFSSYFASKRAAKFGVFFIVFGTSLLLPIDNAGATQTGPVNVICAKADGEQRTFTPSWDNSNQFFAGKGSISHLFCEGGYAGAYRVFVSNNLSNTALDYFQGILPVPVAPSVTESQTSTVDSPTATLTPAPTPTESVTVQNQPDTSTTQSVPVVSDSPTATVSESQTVQEESATLIVPTAPTISDSATSTNPESQTAQVPAPVSDSSTVSAPVAPVLPIPDSSSLVQETVTVIVPVQPEVPSPSSPIEPSPTPAPSVSEPAVVVVEPVPAQPQPVPDPDPDPVIAQPDPEPIEQPVVEPEPVEPVEPQPVEPVEPISDPVEEPAPIDIPNDQVQPSSPIVPEPQPFQPSQSPVSVNDVDVATLPPDTPVELENGVILTAEVVVALELFENPGELLASILTNPAQALKAIANIGADMSPEERKKAQTTTVAAVFTGVAIRRMN